MNLEELEIACPPLPPLAPLVSLTDPLSAIPPSQRCLHRAGKEYWESRSKRESQPGKCFIFVRNEDTGELEEREYDIDGNIGAVRD